MEKEQSDVSIVRGIIDEELATRQKVYKHWVISQIQNRMPHPRIISKLFSNGRNTGDGIKNLRSGAKRVFSDSWKLMKHQYEIDADGWICKKTQPQNGGEMDEFKLDKLLWEYQPRADFLCRDLLEVIKDYRDRLPPTATPDEVTLRDHLIVDAVTKLLNVVIVPGSKKRIAKNLHLNVGE